MPETQRFTVRVSAEMAARLEKTAAAEHLSISDLMRRYIDKGLNIDGYKSEIDFLSDIMATTLTGVIDPYIERVIKLIIKVGKINGAGYYLQLANLLSENNISDADDIADTVNRCNKLALQYMSQKDSDVEKFLLNNMALMREALKIKNVSYGFDFKALRPGGDD